MGASLPSIPPSFLPSSGRDKHHPPPLPLFLSSFSLLSPYPSVPPLSFPISLPLQSPLFLPSLSSSFLPSLFSSLIPPLLSSLPPLQPQGSNPLLLLSLPPVSDTPVTHTEMSRMFSVLSHSDGQGPGDRGWDTVGLGGVTGYTTSGPLVGWPGSPTLLVYV